MRRVTNRHDYSRPQGKLEAANFTIAAHWVGGAACQVPAYQGLVTEDVLSGPVFTTTRGTGTLQELQKAGVL